MAKHTEWTVKLVKYVIVAVVYGELLTLIDRYYGIALPAWNIGSYLHTTLLLLTGATLWKIIE